MNPISDEELTRKQIELERELKLYSEVKNLRFALPKVNEILPCGKCKNARKSLRDGAILDSCKKCYSFLNECSDDDKIATQNMWFNYLAMCTRGATHYKTMEHLGFLYGSDKREDHPGFELEV